METNGWIHPSQVDNILPSHKPIFVWLLFSFFSPENLLEVIFAPIYMLINIVRNLTCWHAYILNGRHYFHVLLF